MIGRHSSKQILAFWLLDNSLLEDFQGDPQSIVKIGEGTYSETFRAGKIVCKMVPIDGELLVNKELQKMFSYFTLVASFFFSQLFFSVRSYLEVGEEGLSSFCGTIVFSI